MHCSNIFRYVRAPYAHWMHVTDIRYVSSFKCAESIAQSMKELLMKDNDCNIDVRGAAHLACYRPISIWWLAITLLQRLRSASRSLRKLFALLQLPTRTVRRI